MNQVVLSSKEKIFVRCNFYTICMHSKYRISSENLHPSHKLRFQLDSGGSSNVSEIQRTLEMSVQFNK